MPLSRAIVWGDSGQASVFRFGADDLAQVRLRAGQPAAGLLLQARQPADVTRA